MNHFVRNLFNKITQELVIYFNHYFFFIIKIKINSSAITNSTAKLKKLVEAHLTKLEANYNLAVVCLVELRQPNPKLRQTTGEVLRRYFCLIEQIVEEGQANVRVS